MSYRVEIELPSCCAEHLHLAAEAEGCTPERMLVMACMVGLLNWSAWTLNPTATAMQMICDSTSQMMQPWRREASE